MGERKLSKGVTIRQEEGREPKLRLSFTYMGIHCRETLDLPVTPPNIKYAERLLGEIKNGIERGTFRYADHFPKSTRLKVFGVATTGDTLGDIIDRLISHAESRRASPNTIKSMRDRKKAIGTLCSVETASITQAVIKQWILAQEKHGSAYSTIQNKLNLIKQALNEAVIEGVISVNPAKLIEVRKYVAIRKESDDGQDGLPDPFDVKERQAILDACIIEEHKNLIGFAFETGMRTGELIAVKWQDIDWINSQVHVRRSMALGEEKSPKTAAGNRKIDLSPEAIRYLTSQRKYTELVGERVFHDPGTGKPWVGAITIRKKAWIPTLKRARVRYRKPYNTRHTYATMHITRGSNLWWLAKQLGHRSPSTLFAHYGDYLKGYENEQNSGQNQVHHST